MQMNKTAIMRVIAFTLGLVIAVSVAEAARRRWWMRGGGGGGFRGGGASVYVPGGGGGFPAAVSVEVEAVTSCAVVDQAFNAVAESVCYA